ncbi:MAG TPA: PRC and DUF2382 domain-containing protein [Actinokineospora sp.]|nr:PRC and DUF2382 domain-containing protein [Actinokineospora sp.]
MTMSMKPQDLIGHDVFDPNGEKIGRVETVYVGEESHEPEWVTVRTGLFGHRETFVPLAGARNEATGLRVGVHKDVVKDAPHVDAEGKLSEQEGIDLRRHYGLPIQRGGTGPIPRPGGEQPRPTPTPARPTDTAIDQNPAGTTSRHDLRTDQPDRERSLRDRAMRAKNDVHLHDIPVRDTEPPDPLLNKTAPHDTPPLETKHDPLHDAATRNPAMGAPEAADKTSQNMAPRGRSTHAPSTTETTRPRNAADQAEQVVIRSEERLRVDVERVAVSRVRLRKYVVTEPQQVTVQLTHEEIHIEREPVGEAELAAFHADPTSFAEEVVEVTLHRERPVVTKDTVPVERIRLGTRPVIVDHTVTEDIRKEQFDIIDDAGPGEPRPGDNGEPRH